MYNILRNRNPFYSRSQVTYPQNPYTSGMGQNIRHPSKRSRPRKTRKKDSSSAIIYFILILLIIIIIVGIFGYFKYYSNEEVKDDKDTDIDTKEVIDKNNTTIIPFLELIKKPNKNLVLNAKLNICTFGSSKDTSKLSNLMGIDPIGIKQAILKKIYKNISNDLDTDIFKKEYPKHSNLNIEIGKYLFSNCKNITNKELSDFLSYINNSEKKGIKAEWMGRDMVVKDMFSMIKISLGVKPIPILNKKTKIYYINGVTNKHVQNSKNQYIKLQIYSYHKLFIKNSSKTYYLILFNNYTEKNEDGNNYTIPITTIFYLNDNHTLEFICSPDFKIVKESTFPPLHNLNNITINPAPI
jgi:hypothetical protein